MTAQVVHGTVPGDTIHMDSIMRGAPWSCGVHNRAGLSWVPLLWGSCSTSEHNRNNGSCGYLFVVLSYDVISSVGINSWEQKPCLTRHLQGRAQCLVVSGSLSELVVSKAEACVLGSSSHGSRSVQGLSLCDL